MKNKRIKITIVITSIVLIISIIVVMIFPYLRFYVKYKEIVDNDYYFEVYYEITNKIIPIGDVGKGKIEGRKNENKVYASITGNDKKYLEIYAGENKNIVVNIEPLLDIIMEKLNVGILGLFVGDVNISVNTIEKIFGEDLAELINISNTVQNDDKKISWSVDDEFKMAEDISWFSEIEFDFKKSKTIHINIDDIQMNLKTYDNKVAGYVTIGSTEVKIVGSYKLDNVKEIVIPEDSIDEKTIDKIKKVYDYWKALIR